MALKLKVQGTEVTQSGTLTVTAGAGELAQLTTLAQSVLGRPEVDLESWVVESAPPPPPPPPQDEEEEG